MRRYSGLRGRLADLVTGGDYSRLSVRCGELAAKERERTEELIATAGVSRERKERIARLELLNDGLRSENRLLAGRLDERRRHDEATHTWEDQPRDEHERFSSREDGEKDKHNE